MSNEFFIIRNNLDGQYARMVPEGQAVCQSFTDEILSAKRYASKDEAVKSAKLAAARNNLRNVESEVGYGTSNDYPTDFTVLRVVMAVEEA